MFSGQTKVDFAKWREIAMVKAQFKKREEYRITYKSGLKVDTGVDNLKEIGDGRVITGESAASQYWVVFCTMTLETKKMDKVKTETKITKVEDEK